MNLFRHTFYEVLLGDKNIIINKLLLAFTLVAVIVQLISNHKRCA